MLKGRPGVQHRTVLFLEPKRAAATLGYFVLAVVAVAVVLAALCYRYRYFVHEPPEGWDKWAHKYVEPSSSWVWIAAVSAGGLALLFLIGVIVNGRRWRTARTVKRLSSDPALVAIQPDTSIPPPMDRAPVIPPLTVVFKTPRQFAKPRGKLHAVTPERNVVGLPPLRIAYLRLFENQPRARTFVQGAWREFGYVYFLRSAAAVTPAELRQAKRSGNVAGLFVASADRLRADLDRSGEPIAAKGRHKFTQVAARTVRVRDRYGSYPVRAVLCHGAFWKDAVDELLRRVDLVALDLSGYAQKNAGTRHELQRVVDRVPIERAIFLADPYSKRSFLENELRLAWAQMAPGSPNATGVSRTALVAVTDYMRKTVTQNEHGQTTRVDYRLYARRRQTRRVVAAAQGRVNDSRRSPTGISR